MAVSDSGGFRPLQGLTQTLKYPGWRMVLVGFIVLFFGFGGPTSTMPLLYGQVIQEFGWSRTAATLIYTYKDITSAVMALFIVGPMIDRFGLRPVIMFSLLATGIGMAAFFVIDSLWTYYLSGFIKGLGQATILICCKLLVSRWFMRNVGLAVGLAIVGTSVGGVIFPIICQYLIDMYGWRIAFGSMSLGVFAVAIPVYLLMAKDNPTEAELLPEATISSSGVINSPEQLKAADLGDSYWSIVKTPMFWCIMIGVVLISAVDQGLFQHTMLYLTNEANLSSQVAAAAVSVTFALGIVSKFGAGKFFDWLSIKGIAIWYLAVAVVVVLAFPVQGLITALLFTSARGAVHGGLISESPVIAKHCYGPRLMNRILPVLTGCFAIGSAFGPVTLGLIYDHFGSYTVGFILFIALALIAAALLSQVKPLYRNRLKAAGAQPAAGASTRGDPQIAD